MSTQFENTISSSEDIYGLEYFECSGRMLNHVRHYR